MTTAGGASTGTRPRWQPVRIAVTVALCCVVIGLLVWQRQRLAGLPQLLVHANWAWVMAAVFAQTASIGALAREQRRLISVRGGRRPLPSVMATTWAGNAIAVSLPLVGSAAAAVFVYRRFTAIGVDRTVAAWTLAISGLFSTVTFAAIVAGGAIFSGSTSLAVTGVITVLAGVLPVCLVLVGLRRPRVHAGAITVLTTVLRASQRLVRRPKGTAPDISAATLDQLTSLRLTAPSAVVVATTASLNWILDLACLVCAILSVHGLVPWHGVVLAWAAGSTVSSLGLTPGGLGVVEIALGAALVGVGLPAGVAIAAALLYRAVKLGLLLAVGGITLLFIRRTPSVPPVVRDG